MALTKQDHALLALLTTTVGYEYRSELFRNLAAQAEARAILTLLKARGIAVPDDVREEILGCTDLTQLDAWLLRAASASTIEDVTRA
jgi:ketopantoate reductase